MARINLNNLAKATWKIGFINLENGLTIVGEMGQFNFKDWPGPLGKWALSTQIRTWPNQR
jgi:hypothetical protein